MFSCAVLSSGLETQLSTDDLILKCTSERVNLNGPFEITTVYAFVFN